MLKLMNAGGGCVLDEAISNPILKVYEPHSSQASFFFYRRCFVHSLTIKLDGL